jgi:general secretion pathway protein F
VASQNYSYEACDAQGKVIRGQIAADSEQEVIASLSARQLIPTRIEALAASGETSWWSRRRVGAADLIEFTNGLCTLVEAHVPLDKALGLLEGITEKPAVRELVAGMRREVKEGKSLADAMQNRPEVFSRMYANVVRAGEEGGILDKLLPRLAKFMEEADEARRTVVSALIYPFILGIVGLASVILLLVFVVPKFAVLFEDMGDAMPPSAAFLLGLSHWMTYYGWLLVFLPPLLAYLWKYLGATPERRLRRDASLLSLPILGSLLLHAESSRLCRTLGALLGSGIPLLKSLSISRGVMENRALETSLAQAEEAVRGGVSLGRALANSGRFPVLLPQLVIVGEESGRTATILEKLAESFDTYVRQQTTRLVGLVEPLLIVILGTIVGAVVIIMLSAIFSINDMQF